MDNAESWLPFTDLVFIDPIGTGFSRIIQDIPSETKPQDGTSSTNTDQGEFFQLQRDLDSLGEFMQRFLTRHKRWASPVFIAGESYGGYRVAKLTRRLQERFGIGLKGAIMISPAPELSVLDFSDYNVVPYVNVFPALTATACIHGKAGRGTKDTNLLVKRAERFAVEKLPRALLEGASLPRDLTKELDDEMSALTGLPREVIQRLQRRLSPFRFQRELLRSEGQFCGIYDGSLTAVDPFPDRDTFEGPDPTSRDTDRVFTTGINMLIRDELGITSERSYHVFSEEAFMKWRFDVPRSFLQSENGATDDLRYGLALNEDMRVMVVHGLFDLITPYFASRRVLDSLFLEKKHRARITFETYMGGHMFYSWDESRKRFARSAEALYR